MKVYCLLHEVKTSYFLRSLQITVERKALIHYHVPESYLFPPVKILCQQLQLWSPLEYDCDCESFSKIHLISVQAKLVN